MEYHTENNGIIVRLDVDDDVKESLREVIVAEGLTGASITGLGAIKEFTLGYFNPDTQEYKRDTFSESHELINATGVVSRQDGEPHIHLHATVAGPNHRARGGHLHNGKVAAAGEFFLTPYGTKIQRQHNSNLDLDVMTFQDD